MRWFTNGCETEPMVDDGGGFYRFEGPYAVGAGATCSRDTSIKRSGTASRANNTGASASNSYTNFNVGLQGEFGYYLRFYFRVSALPSTSSTLAILSDNSILLTSARLTSGGKLQLWNDVAASQIGSDSAATIAVDTWYRLELYTKVISAGTDEAALRLDGTTVASASGLALSTSMVTLGYFGWCNGDHTANSIINIDDVALNDDQGATNNSWPGEGSIVYLNAISDNARGANWTGGAGGTTSLFEAVNNSPPSGVAAGSATNTSQIKNTNTADVTGNYDADMESYTTAGLTAADTIALVQSIFQVGSSAATNITSAIRIVSNPAQGSEESKLSGTGAAIGTYGSEWHTHWGEAQDSPSVTLGTSPVLRFGRRGTEAAELHCCGMRIAVEYVPGEASTFVSRGTMTSRGVAW